MNQTIRKHRPFWPWLLGLLLVGVVLGGLGLFQLWSWLAGYQAATPQQAILNCIRTVQQGSVELPPQEQLPTSRFVSQSDYERAVQALLRSLPAEYDELRFSQSGDADQNHYTVTDGAGRTARFALYPKQEGKGWQAWPLVQFDRTLTVQAPASVQVQVNGLSLTEEEQTGSVPVPGFEALGDAAPRLNSYEITGLYGSPQVECSSELGECVLSWQGESEVTAALQPAAGDAAALAAFFEQAARQYALFVSDDVKFAALSPLLIADTDFYNSLRTFDARWYVSHDATGFEELAVSDLQSYGGDAASATVSFTYVVKKEGLKPRYYPSQYRMHAVRADGVWKLLELKVQ